MPNKRSPLEMARAAIHQAHDHSAADQFGAPAAARCAGVHVLEVEHPDPEVEQDGAPAGRD